VRWLVGSIIVAACAHPPPPRTPAWTACGASEAVDEAHPDPAELLERPEPALAGLPIVRVAVRGPASLADANLAGALATKVGDVFDREAIDRDVRRLWRLGVVSEVRIDATRERLGVAITFVVDAAPLVRTMTTDPVPDDDGAREAHLRAMAGGIYDPMRLHRAGHRLEEELKSIGHMKAAVAVRARRAGPGLVDVCVAAAPGPRYVIDRIDFPGARRIDQDALRALVRRASGDIDAAGGAYRAEMLDEDIMKIDAAYYDAGMVNVKVGSPVVVIDEGRARVVVKVPIVEGDVFRIGAIAWKGVAAGDVARYASELGVKSGDVFTRTALATGLDKLRSLERDRGHKGDVDPATAIDTTRHVIDLTIEVAP
jgi:outer membrane protein insertion porin family